MAKQKREIKKEAINAAAAATSASKKKKKSASAAGRTDAELDNVTNMTKTLDEKPATIKTATGGGGGGGTGEEKKNQKNRNNRKKTSINGAKKRPGANDVKIQVVGLISD